LNSCVFSFFLTIIAKNSHFVVNFLPILFVFLKKKIAKMLCVWRIIIFLYAKIDEFNFVEKQDFSPKLFQFKSPNLKHCNKNKMLFCFFLTPNPNLNTTPI